MRNSTNPISVAAVATSLLFAVPALAGTIYVAPKGANTSTCGTAAAPCQTLQFAHGRVDPGGTLLMTEPGNYGPATFTKPLSAFFVPGAGIYSPTVPCLTISSVGATDTIHIDGLNCIMDGLANDGIKFLDGYKLRLSNTVVRGVTGAFCGVRFAPSSGMTELLINKSTFSENGTTGTNNGGGICVMPSGTANVFGDFWNTNLQNNRHGVVAAPTGSAISNIILGTSDISANAGGVFSVGANSKICLHDTYITKNSFMGLGGGGGLLDGGDNLLWLNAAAGAYTGTCP
jgi:hypothetical protein